MRYKEAKDFFEDKKVLITGNTGFKGSWLNQIMHEFNAKISGYSLKPATTPNLFKILNINKKSKTHFKDIRDIPNLQNALKKDKPEIIFHMAAQALVRDSYDDPINTFSTNILGTANLLEAAKKIDSIKSIVVITTDKVYETNTDLMPYSEKDPLGGHDPYSASKACSELIVQSYLKSFFKNEKIVTARAGNVLGGGDWAKDRLIPDIVRAIFEKDEKIVLRNPGAIRPWQHVLDPLLGYLALSKELHNGEKLKLTSWNFSPDSSKTTVEEVVKKSIKITKKGSYSIKKDSTKHETEQLLISSENANKFLKWKSKLNTNDTLQWTFDWYREYYNNTDMEKFTSNQIKRYFEL